MPIDDRCTRRRTLGMKPRPKERHMQRVTRTLRLTLASVTLAITTLAPASALAGSMHHSYCSTHHHLTHHQMMMHHCPRHSMHH
jgi:hypothetical protein